MYKGKLCTFYNLCMDEKKRKQMMRKSLLDAAERSITEIGEIFNKKIDDINDVSAITDSSIEATNNE